jgi:hypothetical protein
MPPIRCFLLAPTTQVKVSLRRYSTFDDRCVNNWCHNAMAFVEVREELASDATRNATEEEKKASLWPTICQQCGKYQFRDTDFWQHFIESLYARTDTGEKMTLRDAPPGAMWYADWMLSEGHNWMKGPDGHCLMVKCPGGDWSPDQRASNCDMPDDDNHKCWVRHGAPPIVTVDKNGLTCHAGAGSIGQPTWHGFLTEGVLSESR